LGTNRIVWEEAARAVDGRLGDRIEAADSWRSKYLPRVRAVTELGARSADAAERVAEAVIEHPDWLRLEGRRVALLGAAAETSPLEPLSAWGAEVLAVDLPGSAPSARLLDVARRGAGRVHVPVRPGGSDPARSAGVNLITEVPELTGWLRRLAEDRPLVLGFYIYASGRLHVQATIGADAVADHLLGSGHDVAVAYAGTPSDCYLVPAEVVEDSAVRRRHRGVRQFIEEPVRVLSGHRPYADAYRQLLTGEDGERWGVADALIKQQGPNYALAKRLRRWRAVGAWREGRSASFNVAPPTWTASVTNNRLLAAGYYGAKYVGMEVFAPETMRAVMTALLVSDLYNPPSNPHPDARIAHGAVHGGYWRRPDDIRSTLIYTAALGLPQAYAPLLRIR
jgi:hypothetical protein